MKLFGRKVDPISALYPNICLACDKVVKTDEHFCNECRHYIRRISHPNCKRCGRSKKRCLGTCKTPSYDFVCAPFYYYGAIRAAIKNFKFKGRQRSAEYLGVKMAEYLKAEHPDFIPDAVTYVPMTKRQETDRGYNQSRILAKKVAEELNSELRDDILFKKYEIEPQHNLKSVYRAGNVVGVFDIQNKEAINGKNILLVDDIKTTGSTLNECAKMLKMYGAEKVGCVCAAIAI